MEVGWETGAGESGEPVEAEFGFDGIELSEHSLLDVVVETVAVLNLLFVVREAVSLTLQRLRGAESRADRGQEDNE